MSGEQIYVSHAPDDLELVQDLFSTVKNFPFGVHVALEALDPGRSRKRLESRLANSDVVVAVLTTGSADSQWINQEIGYAVGNGIPVVPLYDHETCRGGYVEETDGVTIARENPTKTIFELLGHLRGHLAPLGGLSVPNWYIEFPCTITDCGHPVTLDIDQDQAKLWKRHTHGKLLTTSCGVCEATYYFDPATIGYVRREDGIL